MGNMDMAGKLPYAINNLRWHHCKLLPTAVETLRFACVVLHGTHHRFFLQLCCPEREKHG